MTGIVEKNKMVVMMTMMIWKIMAKEKWFLTCTSNVSIKYKLLTRKGKTKKVRHIQVTHNMETNVNMNNKK